MAGRTPAVAKNIALGLAITALILAGGEAAQRIRYAIRYKHTYWLLYGFVEKPKDYWARMERHHVRPESPPGGGQEAPRPRQADSPVGQRQFEFFTIGHDNYYKFRPGRFRVNSKEGVFYTINSHGLRGGEFQSPKPPGVTRILSLGGSSTFGILNDDDYTYPAILERLLASEAEGRYEVLNGGFPGADLESLEAFLSKERPLLEPDIITVYSLFNNIFPIQVWGPSKRLAWRLRQWLAERSLVFRTALEKYTIWRYGPGFIGTTRFDFRRNARMVSDELVWRPFSSHLSGIVEGAKEHGARVLLIKQALVLDQGPWASLFQPEELWEAHVGTARRIIDETAREHGLPVLDAQALFDPKERPRYFDDPVHLSDEGNALLARAILDKLRELGWVGPKAPGPPVPEAPPAL